MNISVKAVAVEDIFRWRDLYRREMNCQIIHDDVHARAGWTQSYRIEVDDLTAGYGSVLIGGPWNDTRTAFEYYLTPAYRVRAFDCFESFVAASEATAMTVQTNDRLITVMLHHWARNIFVEKIVFEDKVRTAHTLEGAMLKGPGGEDQDWSIEVDGEAVARGGILYHYNRPYGDIYMEVAEAFRRRGIGSYLVQELKRICHELGSAPCARCNPDNIASRKTLQKAGFVACAHILSGTL